MRNGTTGDINGDGYSDLVLFSWHEDELPHGKLNLYLGSDLGLPALPNWTISRSADDYQPIFGEADFEGDGYNDLVANAGYATTMGDYFKGNVTGFSATISATFPNPTPGNSTNIVRMTSGDVNADAISDLIANAYFMRSTVIYVSSAGLPLTPTNTLGGLTKTTDDNPCIAVIDSNADYRDDIVTGLNGSLYSFTAATAGFSNSPTQAIQSLYPVSDNYGSDCLGGLLVGQDESLDLVVSAPSTTAGGTLYVYSAGVVKNAVPIALTNPAGANDWYFGDKLQVPGDLDGDGNDDLVACDSEYATGTGRALAYYGPIVANTPSHVIDAPTTGLIYCNDLF